MIADGKRGDVPVTAAAYAQALVGETPGPFGAVPGLGADAFTANPLLGRDALEPLIEAARGGRRRLLRARPHLQPRRGRAAGRRRAAAARAARAAWSTSSASDAVGRLRALARGRGHRRHRAGPARPAARADAARDLPAARRGRPGRARGGPRAGLRAASGRRARHRVALDRERPPASAAATRPRAAADAAEELRAAAWSVRLGTALDSAGARTLCSASSRLGSQMHETGHRSPARLLAPLALVAVALAVVLVVLELRRQRRRRRRRQRSARPVGHLDAHIHDRRPRRRRAAATYTVKTGDTLGADRGEDRRVRRAPPGAESRARPAGAAVGAEDQAARVTRRARIARDRGRRRRRRCPCRGRRGPGRRRRSRRRRRSWSTRSDGHVMFAGRPRRAPGDRQHHQADDRAARARAGASRRTCSRRPTTTRRRRSRGSTCAAGERMTVSRPARGAAARERQRRGGDAGRGVVRLARPRSSTR